MENKNVLTINFNNTEDLALQIAEWNYILNHQCCGNCHDDKTHVETACETIDVETVVPTVETKTTKSEKAEVKEEKAPNKVAKVEQDIHVTDLEGNPIKVEKEETIKPVAEPEPAEATKVEEQAPVDTELDVAAEPVDKKAFYGEIRNWMGTDKVRAGKVLTVFKKHGIVGKISSDALTDDIITDLKTVMAGEE